MFKKILIILIILMLLPSNVLSISKTASRCLKYKSIVNKYLMFFNLNFNGAYFLGQIEQESSCLPSVLAADGGKGLAQFMDPTWEEIRNELKLPVEASPFNVKYSIMGMIYYDRKIYNEFKRLDLCVPYCPEYSEFDIERCSLYYVFRAYNGGLGQLKKEIYKAGYCDFDEIEKNCLRKPTNCNINIQYPYNIFMRAMKYF